jgi:hypothetical protein
MDTGRLEELRRLFTTRPSRRDISRVLFGLLTGSVLASLMSGGVAESKNRHHHKGNHRRKNKNKNRNLSQACPAPTKWCDAGPYSGCCNTESINNYDPREICTEQCGCCEFGVALCCAAGQFAFCCGSDDVCCRGTDFQIPVCCGTGEKCCPGGDAPGCCPPERPVCCGNDCCSSAACQTDPFGECFPKDGGH